MSTSSPATVRKVRDRLAAFFLETSNGEIDDFESAGVIESVTPYEVFSITIRTLFESRSLENRERFYARETLPTFSVTDEKVNVWNTTIAAANAFADNRVDYRIEHSERIQACAGCARKGRSEERRV